MTRTELGSSQIKGVDLTVDVTGTLPIGNGGTGNTSNAAASCTGNAATATTASACSGNAATATKWAAAITVNGVNLDGTGNIVVVPRVGTTASSATPSIDCALYEQYNITALAVAITGFTFTNVFDGCKLLVRITGTASRAIVWGSGAQSSGVATLLATTSGTNTHMVGLIYDSVKAKMVCHAVDATGY